MAKSSEKVYRFRVSVLPGDRRALLPLPGQVFGRGEQVRWALSASRKYKPALRKALREPEGTVFLVKGLHRSSSCLSPAYLFTKLSKEGEDALPLFGAEE